MNKIKLIVLEGLDGSGKSTQIDLLKSYFSTEKIKYRYLHFPVTDSKPYGELVSSFLRGEFGDSSSVHPQLVALLFALNRSEFQKILSGTEFDSEVVLLDRYVYSNVAFQCSKIEDFEQKICLQDWILNFEYNFLKLPKPDFSLYLDVPIDFMKQNLFQTRKGRSRAYLNGQQDIHEASISLQEKVASEYERLVLNFKDIKKIQCFDGNGILTPEDISSKVIKAIKTELF